MLTGRVGDPSANLVASSSSILLISFTSDTPAVASVNGSALNFNSPGFAIITASQDGDENYEAAFVHQTYTVFGNGDDDGDGQTNADELIAGTDPLNANSRFAIETIVATPNETTLTWTAVPGRTYTVQACEDLTSWVSIGTGTVKMFNDLLIGSYIDHPVISPSRRFYRIVVQ